MPDISRLIPDIYARLDVPVPFEEEEVLAFGHNLAKKLANRLAEERGAQTLRLSNWGSKCERQLYLKINMPHLVETLPAHVRLKFLMGDIAEEVLLFLAKAAGHTVEGEQDELEVAGVVGHRDGIIDGRLVDAKSASPYGFKKFQEHGLEADDPFGYIGQLGSYHSASRDDPRVHDKEKASFLAIDKVSGKLVLDTYSFKDSGNLEPALEAKKEMLRGPIPPRGYEDEEMGKSGNRKLGVACSYCPVKSSCWPNLRVFGYSQGPVFLTVVADPPRVPEISLDHVDT
jgi:hypothetical protein